MNCTYDFKHVIIDFFSSTIVKVRNKILNHVIELGQTKSEKYLGAPKKDSLWIEILVALGKETTCKRSHLEKAHIPTFKLSPMNSTVSRNKFSTNAKFLISFTLSGIVIFLILVSEKASSPID